MFWVKSYHTHVLSRWVGCCEMRTASHTNLPRCNDWGLTEDWLWHVVSLWWRSWNMIMIPNHRTSMIPLWHCKIGYRVGWWHGSRCTAEKKKSHPILHFTYLFHIIGEESVVLSLLYIQLFEIGVKVAFCNGSAVAYNKVDLLRYPRRSSCCERTDNTFVLLICVCFFHL